MFWYSVLLFTFFQPCMVHGTEESCHHLSYTFTASLSVCVGDPSYTHAHAEFFHTHTLNSFVFRASMFMIMHHFTTLLNTTCRKSKSDPFVAVFARACDDSDSVPQYIGHTEFKKNDHDPDFATTVQLSALFEVDAAGKRVLVKDQGMWMHHHIASIFRCCHNVE